MNILKCTGLDHYGRGISIYNNKIIFIEDFLPGEKADIEIVKEKNKFYIGKVKELIEISNNRVPVIHNEAFKTKTAPLLHMNYDYQLEFKKDKVKELFLKFANTELSNLSIKSSPEYNYRNKVTLKVYSKKLAYNMHKSNELVNIDECPLVMTEINKVIEKLNAYLKDNIVFDEVIIRANYNNEIMLLFKGKLNLKAMLSALKEIKLISIYLNNEKVFGEEYISYKLFDNIFNIYGDAFYQINSYQIENLFNPILDYVKTKNIKTALDLYCGSGAIGITISDYVEKVVGIDSNKNSINSANINKKINNKKNIEFVNNKVEDIIDNIIEEYKNIDLIVVDPPRSGLDAVTINNILNVKPNNIVYVSCDPVTLSRDIKILKEQYNLEHIELIDMFPNTYHVESVVLMSRFS